MGDVDVLVNLGRYLDLLFERVDSIRKAERYLATLDIENIGLGEKWRKGQKEYWKGREKDFVEDALVYIGGIQAIFGGHVSALQRLSEMPKGEILAALLGYGLESL